MSEDTKDTFKSIGYIAFSIPLLLWKGYVLSVLWSWFLVDLVTVVEITMFQASGIILATKIMTTDFSVLSKDEIKYGMAIAVSIGGPAVFLFFGWLINLMISVRVTF